jgi:hypothetical protein
LFGKGVFIVWIEVVVQDGNVGRGRLSDNVLDQTIEKLSAVLDRQLSIGSQLAESIEDVVEVDENLTLGDFCNVVHALASIVSDSCVLVGKASQNRRYYVAEVTSNVDSESDGGSSQTDETTIACMGLVDGVGVVVAELVDNLLDADVVVVGQRVADDGFEFQGAALATVIQLVGQGLLHREVHVWRRW